MVENTVWAISVVRLRNWRPVRVCRLRIVVDPLCSHRCDLGLDRSLTCNLSHPANAESPRGAGAGSGGWRRWCTGSVPSVSNGLAHHHLGGNCGLVGDVLFEFCVQASDTRLETTGREDKLRFHAARSL